MGIFDTPLGNATFREILGKGITRYTVELCSDEKEYAVVLTPDRNAEIPIGMQSSTGWYLGMQIQILPLIFRGIFTSEEFKKSELYYRTNFPYVYEEVLGGDVHILPTKLISAAKHRDRFFKQHCAEYLETKSWHNRENVPEGYVLVEAAIGGDVNCGDIRYFLVGEIEYELERTDYGFVCIYGTHDERNLII